MGFNSGFKGLIRDTDFNLTGSPPSRNIKKSVLKWLSCRLFQPDALALVLPLIRSM